jgi:ParB/RepB/Spo0J family partition protein
MAKTTKTASKATSIKSNGKSGAKLLQEIANKAKANTKKVDLEEKVDLELDAGGVEIVPIDSIKCDESWNARSGDFTKNADNSTGESFESLVESIKNVGLQNALIVRPKNPGDKGKYMYTLVAGFRRHKACKLLKLADVAVRVVPLDDMEARMINIVENTNREGLSGADLAYGLWDVFQWKLPETNSPISDNKLAKAIGLSQPYVSRLHQIMENTDRAVTDLWRSSNVVVSVAAMEKISKLSKDLQMKAFEDALRDKPGSNSDGDKHDGVLERLLNQASILASKLAELTAADLATIHGLDEDGDCDVVAEILFREALKVKKDTDDETMLIRKEAIGKKLVSVYATELDRFTKEFARNERPDTEPTYPKEGAQA